MQSFVHMWYWNERERESLLRRRRRCMSRLSLLIPSKYIVVSRNRTRRTVRRLEFIVCMYVCGESLYVLKYHFSLWVRFLSVLSFWSLVVVVTPCFIVSSSSDSERYPLGVWCVCLALDIHPTQPMQKKSCVLGENVDWTRFVCEFEHTRKRPNVWMLVC